MDFQKAIEIKNLSYTYPDGNIALKDINLEIFENECLALIGSNGSGKTTLILNLNGIFRGKGCLKIFNKELSDKNLKEIRKDIGIVFQNPDDQLFMPTVFDDVAFAPLNMSLDEKEVKVRVKNALQAVGMNIYENRFSHHLSFGEKKKISIATILSMNPKIIVFDEPTANLDAKSKKDLIKIIKNLKKDGKTLIIATHDLDSVLDVVDRIAVLNRTIVAYGKTREIITNEKLFEDENLDVPNIAILFKTLTSLGYDCKDIPLSMDAVLEKFKTRR